MTQPETADVELTELYDADLPRVDLVTKGANGMPFLIAKSDDSAGLLDAGFVRELIAKSTPTETDPTVPTDDAAMIAKTIHDAAVRAAEPTEDVEKADPQTPDVAVDDIVAEVPGGSTAETVPGSNDWETLDSETALNALSVLGRVKAVIEWLADREATEAVTADPDDAENAFDLQSAACAIDSVIGQLAQFAVGEKLEADLAEETSDVAKAVGEIVTGAVEPLSVIEPLVPVAKAGRVLSTTNEGLLRGAVDSLQKVLSSLPAAPPALDAPVAKEEAEVTAPEPEAPAIDVTKLDVQAAAENLAAANAAAAQFTAELAATVEKAKGDPQLAVFNENGKLIGTVDPTDLNPIATSTSGEEPTAPPADTTPADPATVGTPAAPAAAAPAPAPAPKPDEQVAKSDTDALAVLKSIVDGQVADVIKGLQEQIDYLKAPAAPRIVSNGATPPERLLRGQNQTTGVDVDVTKAEELETELAKAATPAERERISNELGQLAANALTALHAAARRG